jgi:hypothetical protein
LGQESGVSGHSARAILTGNQTVKKVGMLLEAVSFGHGIKQGTTVRNQHFHQSEKDEGKIHMPRRNAPTTKLKIVAFSQKGS